MRINIISKNQIFAEDLVQQIERYIEQVELSSVEPDKQSELVFVDEQEEIAKKIAEKYADLPIVLLSTICESSEYADIVIKKPFKLQDILEALKNKTLLPKVRRKECLNFKEYSLYPIKKEIISAKSGKSFKLTEKEVAILKYLYQNASQISEKEELLENVWEYSADATTHTVETHIYRLRQKVEQDEGSQLIITENNGYRLNI
ncbi:MAG: winged helix-turn-helix domain-containing protein [Acetobacter sp.]|nr:winged helix-turn-helix domain-containing protein [Acetobacter sp.]